MAPRLSLCSLILALAVVPSVIAGPDRTRPNVVVILADDLGFSDLGCYGGEIATPNLDKLAASGLRFTQFHNTARCWPSRAALLTGYYAQQVRRDKVPGLPASGNGGTRPEWAKLLPDYLKSAGYHSYMSGKWHVDGQPLKNGFERSYRLEDAGRYFSPKNHSEDDHPLPPIPRGTDYYTTTAIADHAITYLKEHEARSKADPFFLYLTFTAPHFPLHAKPEDIAKYRDRYKAGWEAVRQERWAKSKTLGIVPGELSDVERRIGPPYDRPADIKTLGPGEVNRPLPWSDLTDQQRDFQATKMAIHAAMVDRMDQEIGRVLDQLRSSGRFENTIIFFLSDNGASAEIMVRDDGHDPSAPPGSADTHLCLGPGWSNVANTPFRRHKTWVHEGGIATPLIVHWPAGIAAKGELRRDPGHVIDLAPTILELAGARKPQKIGDKPVPDAPGKSLVPAFGDGKVTRDDLWWEHEGNRAIRVGDWKLVKAREESWELFDLKSDPSETKNLAASMPQKVQELSKRWQDRADAYYALAKSDGKATVATKAAPRAPVKELILPGESFLVQGRPSFIMLPEPAKRSNPQPWIFYAPTLPPYPDQAEKWMHQKFLDAGVAIAGIDVGEAYGSPKGRAYFDALYQELTERRGFAKKPCLLGRSRGGLWVTSWAGANPDKVAGIAGIYPVFDFRTYPKLEKAAPAYGLSPAELEKRIKEFNPIEQAATLAKHKVPVFLIHGDVDVVVPLKENSAELQARYKAEGAGDLIELVVAKGQGHNFWEGFFRCEPLVEFAIRRAKGR